jgi:hypothetical protein
MLGSPPANIAASALDVNVARVSERAYALTLTVDNATGRAERRVQLGSCSEVQEAAALLIATAIDPAAVLRVQQREASAPAPVEPVAQPARSDQSDAALPTRGQRSHHLRWSLSLGAVGDWRSLPGPGGGPQFGLALSLERLRISLAARYLFARSEADPRTDIVSELDLYAGALGVSYLWSFGAVSLGPSAEAELGVLRASSRAGERNGDSNRIFGEWVNALLGTGLAVRASPSVQFELGLFGGIPIRRWKLGVKGSTTRTFYRTRPIHGRATLSIRVSFGSKD